MIQGVHVLYEYSAFGSLKGLIAVMLIPVTILSMLCTIEPILDKGTRKISRLITILAFIAFCIFGWHVMLSIPNDHYVKATVSEEVSAEELLKRYEVVSIEGEIYKLKVLEEKEE